MITYRSVHVAADDEMSCVCAVNKRNGPKFFLTASFDSYICVFMCVCVCLFANCLTLCVCVRVSLPFRCNLVQFHYNFLSCRKCFKFSMCHLNGLKHFEWLSTRWNAIGGRRGWCGKTRTNRTIDLNWNVHTVVWTPNWELQNNQVKRSASPSHTIKVC